MREFIFTKVDDTFHLTAREGEVVLVIEGTDPTAMHAEAITTMATIVPSETPAPDAPAETTPPAETTTTP